MQQRLEEELVSLRRENQLLHTIIDSVSDGVYAAGREGNILVYNKAFEKFEGSEQDVSAVNQLMQQMMDNFDRHLPKARDNGTHFSLNDIIGASPVMTKAILQAKRIAQTKSIVTIIGETGVGKELFAQGIHNASPYANQSFVAINCAAIPDTLMEALMMGTVKGAFSGATDAPGFFEQAEGGTLFLDEINSLSLHLQPKLLRLMQEKTVRRLGDKRERPIKCRIICASNEDLFESVKKRPISRRPVLSTDNAAPLYPTPPESQRRYSFIS